MKSFIIIFFTLCITNVATAQHTLKLKIFRAEYKDSLPAATVRISTIKKQFITDSLGMVIAFNLSDGNYKITVSHIGFLDYQLQVHTPFADSILEIGLLTDEEEEEEVIVQSTRTSRSIRNVPTRVETIELEEIDEKTNMRPGNVSMLLHESTGIQVQQTSATSGNASIRIQGLDGRYTQLLKDGFAGFGNFASGLSVLEIPPLDLKQVEIIKGPASTLFGGGAIGGVVNFISKTPKEKLENLLVLNQSNIGQSNMGYFSSKKSKRIGYTFLAMLGKQLAYDVDDDDFTEVPKSLEWTVNPKLFLYPNERTTIIIGNSFSKGDRTGGDVQAIKGKGDAYHRYFEENNTLRNITTFELQNKINESKSLTVKQSLSIFDRHIEIPAYHFDGINYNSFTDITWLANLKDHSIVTGINLVYDNFKEKEGSAGNRDNTNTTAGAYFQDTWDLSERLKLESGLRVDAARYGNALFNKMEWFALPRVSLLVNLNDHLSSRIGGGLGYKLPTIFTERTETFQYRNIAQINHVTSERSYGGTADINYKARIGSDLDFSLNQLFFYTWIDRPLILVDGGTGDLEFSNANKPIQSLGIETNAKLIFKKNFKLFLGYTFTEAKAKYLPGNQFLPLVPKHKFNSALIYEKQNFIKLGLEGYYTSNQTLYNGFRTDDYWEFGFMAEKLFPRFSIYINFENFTDTRQSRYKRVANDPHPDPTFDDIWTHTEGFVVNGGVKLRF